MISHEHKFIFVHVPKSGGTSVENELALSGPRHNTALQYREHFPEIWERYLSFAFVRNPWDRVLSYYTFRRQVRQLEAEASLTFKEWLLRTAENVRAGNHAALNAELAPVYGVGTLVENDPEGWRVKFDNALHMLSDERGNVIVDFVGRFERLQQDFDVVCEKIGVERSVLPVLNKTEHGPYWSYYDEDCRRLVAELFRDDIEYFDYRYGE